MKDDQMDELLIQGARDYNEPGAIPREEMWMRIAESRRAATHAAERPARRHIATWMAGSVAAALVLSAGIAIGRRIERSTPGIPAVANVPTPTVPATSVAANTSSPQPVANSRQAVPNSQQPAASSQHPAASSQQAAADNQQASLAYRLVVLQHLAGSEAMITAFRASARRGEVDAQIASWSRDLLSTTRMLEASPVKEDPTMRRLLEDLDLVIVQISQYSTRGTVNPDDLELIEQSITKRNVITKLRSTLPARTTPAGT